MYYHQSNGWLDNICMLTDSYKITQYPQYPPNTTNVHAYFASRGGDFAEIVHFGLRYILESYFSGRIVTTEKIAHATRRLEMHFGKKIFNEAGWQYILRVHNGCLPIVIHAIPEGSVIQPGTIQFTIENTDPNCAWLVSPLETILAQLWYPSTVATQSRRMKQIIDKYLQQTGDQSDLPFMLHDFGYRGCTCPMQAGIGGAAHLVNFLGTDTLAAVELIDHFYEEPMAGFSVPASEHSTMTAFGKERELDAYRNMLDKFPTGIMACVSDSYDIYNAIRNIWGTQLHDQVMARDGVLVIRPDSGDPVGVILSVLPIIAEKFGFTHNEKGYKVIDKHVRLIQGDGIDLHSMTGVLEAMKTGQWSTNNIRFGSGGGLLQKLNRDTCKYKFAVSEVTVDGVPRPVFKDPVTDPGKRSTGGRFKVLKDGAKWANVPLQTDGENQLELVFSNGVIYAQKSFKEIRERAQL